MLVRSAQKAGPPRAAIRFDEELSLKEDYDFTAQQLHKYGKVLPARRSAAWGALPARCMAVATSAAHATHATHAHAAAPACDGGDASRV